MKRTQIYFTAKNKGTEHYYILYIHNRRFFWIKILRQSLWFSNAKNSRSTQTYFTLNEISKRKIKRRSRRRKGTHQNSYFCERLVWYTNSRITNILMRVGTWTRIYAIYISLSYQIHMNINVAFLFHHMYLWWEYFAGHLFL